MVYNKYGNQNKMYLLIESNDLLKIMKDFFQS